MQIAITKVSMQVQAHLKQSLATISNCADSERSQSYSIDDDAGTVTGSEVDSIFDYVPEPDTDLETDTLSSCSAFEDIDSSFDTDVDPCECHLPNAPCAAHVEESSVLNIASNFEEPLAVLEPDIELQRVPRVGDIPLSASEEATLTAFANAIAERLEINLKRESRAKSSIRCASYIDFFVPELFDMDEQYQAHVASFKIPVCDVQVDDPPSYQPSIPAIPSPPLTKAQIKAEYLELIVLGLIFLWSLLSQGFRFVKSAIPYICEDSALELRDYAVEITHGARDICGQDEVEVYADPMPPDKSFSPHCEPID
jgi:hypothetical protein